MKKAIQLMTIVVLMASACTKDPVTQLPPVTINPISKIVTDNSIVEATYSTDGNIHTITRKDPGGSNSMNYTFSYENGLLKEVLFGAIGKWKYNYTGNLISSIDTYTQSGSLRYSTRFTYLNNRISEKLEVLVTPVAEFPSFKTKYEFNTEGNISRKEVFYYINNEWKKNEEIAYIKYDRKVNTREHLENIPFVPLGYFSVNNVLRENYLDENGQPLGLAVHEYEYDISGRPVSRKTTNSFIGYQDTYSIASFHY